VTYLKKRRIPAERYCHTATAGKTSKGDVVIRRETAKTPIQQIILTNPNFPLQMARQDALCTALFDSRFTTRCSRIRIPMGRPVKSGRKTGRKARGVTDRRLFGHAPSEDLQGGTWRTRLILERPLGLCTGRIRTGQEPKFAPSAQRGGCMEVGSNPCTLLGPLCPTLTRRGQALQPPKRSFRSRCCRY